MELRLTLAQLELTGEEGLTRLCARNTTVDVDRLVNEIGTRHVQSARRGDDADQLVRIPHIPKPTEQPHNNLIFQVRDTFIVCVFGRNLDSRTLCDPYISYLKERSGEQKSVPTLTFNP